MKTKYVVENPGPVYICDTLADAQEMVLHLVEEFIYEDFAYFDNKYPGWIERMKNIRAKSRNTFNKKETFECFLLDMFAGNNYRIRHGVEIKG